ncbi:hypothetical protein ITP53_03420 [Nonomuraea sp. K274]|uniref:Uncharacterized protein n=1 Tax=Nonomuraea cypriaca TaxID=1187855 RepID=A0A931EY28_9ACTN|nr:hypothetical protein [Nonomuraea cypriaca]MBF8184806.1 hypothetical protein [Nonomuraea cypriaca]
MNTDEQRDLRRLLDHLERLEPWQKLTGEDSGRWQIDPRSPLAGDDAKTHPFEVSHSAWHALTVAMDHIGCLRSSLVGQLDGDRLEVRIHTHAQSSLLRGAVENGARAVWVLGPKDRLTRVTRRLALQFKETKDAERMRELLNNPASKTLQERQQRLVDLLASAGHPAEEAAKTLKTVAATYTAIVREAGELTPRLGGDVAQAVWSGCSALAHGDTFGTMSMLDKEIVARNDDIALVRVTGSISSLFWCTVAATLVIERGFQLFQERGISYR